MTRLTRLTSLLLQLQSSRRITAVQLSQKFGISQRTVYRDIKILEEAGVPVIGEAGSGYSLMQGYRMPPVMFTEVEINALITAQQYFQHHTDRSVTDGYNAAINKIKAILKYSAKEKTEMLSERIQIFNDKINTNKTEYLNTIQSAITNANVLHIKYHSIYADEVSERNIEPLAVYYTKNNWIVIAYCRLRKERREFRLDRVLKLYETGDNFPESDFSFSEYRNTVWK